MKFSNPPVVETVLSAQFNPLQSFGVGQLGAFWKSLGSNWPHVTDAPAVEPAFERFESSTVWEQAAFVKLSSKIDVRLQIRNEAQDRMIQLQNGRFFYNWLATPRAEYPSYEMVRPEFDDYWNKLREFVSAECKEEIVQPNQWEVLYVNHMPRHTVWNELAELPDVLTFLNRSNLAELELKSDGIGGEWRFAIGPNQGRLYVKLGMKIRKDDDTPCVVMTLIARGPAGNGESSLDEGLNLGHKTITDAFDCITSTAAQDYWGVQHDSK